MISVAEIPPGGAGEIKVTFDSEDRRGRQIKTVSVTTNDPKNPSVDLTISANIKIEFSFLAPFISCGRITSCETVTRHVLLEVADMANIKIVDIKSSSPSITAQAVSNLQAEVENRRDILVTILPGLPVGPLRETVTLVSNLESTPEAVLRITGTVTPGLEISPSSLAFALGDGQAATETREKSVRILDQCGEPPLKIQRAEDPEGYLEIRIEALPNGQGFALHALPRADKLPAEKKHDGRIVIQTDNPQHPELVVEYAIFQ